MSTKDIELLHVILRLDNQKDIDIFADYRPPTGNHQLALDYIKLCMESYSRPNQALLLGDFNIDLLNTKCLKKKALGKLMDG